MTKRTVVSVDQATFKPYDRYADPVEGMHWCNFSYEAANGAGSFLLRMDPGCKSFPHEHVNYEDFYVVEGELIDNDGSVFRSGDFVSFRPGSRHWSTTPDGCTLVVFLRQPNRLLEAHESVND